MRLLLGLFVLLMSSRANAAAMPHYDLGGLVAQCEAVVVADRVGSIAAAGALTRYLVRAPLRGTLRAGAEIGLDDQIYKTDGHSIEARVIVFLYRRDGAWQIVPSGLRVIERGKVFRFEQHMNPGPYVMVPQGADPEDARGAANTAQLGVTELERAIGDAAKRLDVVVAAANEHDATARRARLLALFPVAASRTPAPIGFYVDRLAERARAVLIAAGDLEGALMIEQRDRSHHRSDIYGSIPDLVAIAEDTRRSDDLRAIAISVLERHPELSGQPAAIQSTIALIDDRSPRVRLAAISVALLPARVMVSDPALQRRLRGLADTAQRAMAKRYATETDHEVAAAIKDAFQYGFHKPLPARTP